MLPLDAGLAAPKRLVAGAAVVEAAAPPNELAPPKLKDPLRALLAAAGWAGAAADEPNEKGEDWAAAAGAVVPAAFAAGVEVIENEKGLFPPNIFKLRFFEFLVNEN